MKKNKRALKTFSVFLAFVLITAVIFGFLLLEPALKIHGFTNLSAQKLNAGSVGSQQGIQIIDGLGAEVGTLAQSRIFVPLKSLPQHTIDAFVCTEDERFFQHPGTDYWRILGATAANIKAKSFKEGASTITQQLVKNTHLSSEKSLRRKLNEVRLATAIERKYSKNEILEKYLNVIYFGNGATGIGQAALTFFGKSATELTLNESAVLAAVINNPTHYNPLSNTEKCDGRRLLVLSLMLKNGKITREQYDTTIPKMPEIIVPHLPSQYDSFLISEASAALGLTRAELLSGEYVINSYLDGDLQNSVSDLLANYDFKGKEQAIIHALVMTSDGDIITNAATTMHSLTEYYRQPGSVIKPALSYAPAFEKRLIVPLTPILDEPISYGGYTPKNFKHNMGWTSIAETLKHSQNIPAVKLLDMCGVEYGKRIATQLGYTFEKSDNHLALALGGMEKGATLSEIAGSYQAFANDGLVIKPSHISRIFDSSGGIVYSRNKTPTKAVSPETAYFVGEILKECTKEGTARRIGIEPISPTNIGNSRAASINTTSINNFAFNITDYPRDDFDKTDRNPIPASSDSHESNIAARATISKGIVISSKDYLKTIAAKTGTVGSEEGNTDAYSVAYNGAFVVAVHISARKGLLPNSVNGATHPCSLARQILDLLPQCYAFPQDKEQLCLNKPDSIVTQTLDKNEYLINHRLVVAGENIPQKDTLSGSFCKESLPIQPRLSNNFVLQMNDTVFGKMSAYAKHNKANYLIYT